MRMIAIGVWRAAQVRWCMQGMKCGLIIRGLMDFAYVDIVDVVRPHTAFVCGRACSAWGHLCCWYVWGCWPGCGGTFALCGDPAIPLQIISFRDFGRACPGVILGTLRCVVVLPWVANPVKWARLLRVSCPVKWARVGRLPWVANPVKWARLPWVGNSVKWVLIAMLSYPGRQPR